METKNTHISRVRVGDCILCEDGVVRTVSLNNIKNCPFMGISIFGDTYSLGYKPVKVVDPISLNF